MAALYVDFYYLKNMLQQVMLVGLIGFLTAFAVIAYVILKYNIELWNLQSSLLFSMVLSIIDPVLPGKLPEILVFPRCAH